MLGIAAKRDRFVSLDSDDPTACIRTVERARATDVANFRLRSHKYLLTTPPASENRASEPDSVDGPLACGLRRDID